MFTTVGVHNSIHFCKAGRRPVQQLEASMYSTPASQACLGMPFRCRPSMHVRGGTHQCKLHKKPPFTSVEPGIKSGHGSFYLRGELFGTLLGRSTQQLQKRRVMRASTSSPPTMPPPLVPAAAVACRANKGPSTYSAAISFPESTACFVGCLAECCQPRRRPLKGGLHACRWGVTST